MNTQIVAILPLVLVTALGPIAAGAEEVYKSIDAQGQVTYGDAPGGNAATVEQVALPPGPTPDEVRQAREAGEKIAADADQMAAERVTKQRERTEQRKRAEAEAEVNEQVKAADQQLQRNETMREYYGYRDYRFPKPKFPAGTGPGTLKK